MIKKKRIGDTAIITIRSDVYTRTNVDDEEWIKILEEIDRFENVAVNCNDDEFIGSEFKELMKIIDQNYINSMLKRQEAVEELKRKNWIDKDPKDRIRKAKRIVDASDTFEYDEDGICYLKGYDYPLNTVMTAAILDAKYNPLSEYELDSLINFWKYLMLNPDEHVREGLFEWIKTSDFTITKDGNIIAYRNVNIKKTSKQEELEKYVTESWAKIKRWKKSPKNYNVYCVDNNYTLEPSIEAGEYFVGNLSELYSDLNTDEGGIVYTDQYTGKMDIIIGEEVRMPRNECDNNPESSCSRGLHNKSKAYGLNLGSEVLVTLVNPWNVVAIPTYDTTKFRSCAYMPIGRAEFDDNRELITYNAGTYDLPYEGLGSLEEMLKTKDFKTLQENGEISKEVSENYVSSLLDEAKEIMERSKIDVE